MFLLMSNILDIFRFIFLKLFIGRLEKHPKISLLIPISSHNSKDRRVILRWLLRYWKAELPHAEVIIGYSNSKIFCKGEALNKAAKRAKGKVLVVLDADAYMSGKVINRCANKILDNLDNHLWYVPYRHLYRLNKKITKKILASSPDNPLRIPSPPPIEDLDIHCGLNSKYGHRYGAMVMMFPREALDVLGGFDERFKGWGGEDVALLRALDTLYGKHKTTNNDVLHLWHSFIGTSYRTRMWKGQISSNTNQALANSYHKATRHPSKMKKIIDDGKNYRKKFCK